MSKKQLEKHQADLIATAKTLANIRNELSINPEADIATNRITSAFELISFAYEDINELYSDEESDGNGQHVFSVGDFAKVHINPEGYRVFKVAGFSNAIRGIPDGWLVDEHGNVADPRYCKPHRGPFYKAFYDDPTMG